MLSFKNIKLRVKDNEILLLAVLLILGLLVHFLFIWHPAEVVFDEVHYGKFVNGYLRGETFFSGHPPLGVQLLALGAWLGRYRPLFAFEVIGEALADYSFVAIRFMANLAGALIPLAVYFFIRSLKLSPKVAFLTGLFLVFDNALLVQSHYILIDAFLILFGFLGLAFFMTARNRRYNWLFLVLSGVFLGLGCAVKWTALSFVLFCGIVVSYDLAKILLKRLFRVAGKAAARSFIGLIILPVIIYFGVFCIHVKLLPNPGPGDAYMSEQYRTGEKNIVARFIEFNRVNYYSNVKGITSGHPYASQFYTWPFMIRSVFYWVNGDARIYLLGNPIIWWPSTVAILAAIILFFGRLRKDRAVRLLLLGYALNILPFLSIKRVVFLYHYLPALVFAVAIMVYLISASLKKTLFVLLVLSIVTFFYFAPLSYGFKLSPNGFEQRMWLNTWK